MSTTAQAGFAVNVQIKGQGTVEEENGVPLDWGDVSPGTVLEATPTSGWDFGLWVDTDNGDAHSGTTYETPGRDVNLEVVFFRIFYEPATSADDFKIAVNGPTMPRVTLNCGIEPDPSSVNTRIVFRFKFEIGEEVATNPDSFRILCYPDYESASMTRNERIDSGWLEDPTFEILPNDTNHPEQSWDQNGVGIGGGFPRYVDLSCKVVANEGIPNCECVGTPVTKTYGNQTLTGLRPYQQDATGLFHIVGEQPSASAVDAYIDELSFVSIPDPLNPTDYRLQEGTSDAKLGGISQDYDLINVRQGTATPSPLSDTYVTQQIRIMLKKMHRQETNTRHYYFGPYAQGANAGTTNYASRDGYPLWEKSLAESTAPFRYVVTTTGVGLYQLTYSSMKTRETIWNWKKNLIQSCKFMAENYKNSCEHLDGQNQADPALFVYRPGQYYGGTFGFPLTLHVMRRLNALNRFNGGPDDRYYWWNDTQANPSLMTLVNITGGTVNSTNPESVLVPLEFQSVQHNATNPTTAHLTTYDWTSMQSTTAQHPSFFWSVTNAVVPSQYVRDVYQDAQPDDEIWVRMAIYNAAHPSGSDYAASARIGDTNVTDPNAGFRPPAGRWVKFSYIDDPQSSVQNQGYRDYNHDDVRDPGSNVYSIRKGDGTLPTNYGPNAASNKSTYYADHCELKTSEH